jgi:hypothetical protein
MEEQQLNLNEIIVVKQLPEILEQLDKLGEMVDTKLAGIDELECTEENKKLVKNKRAEINATLKLLDDKRKEIKKAINEPYEIFNAKFETTTKKKLENASNLLTEKIDKIENQQKETGIKNIKSYFEEYKQFLHIEDIIQFEDLKLNITLTDLGKNLEGTKYKENIKNRLDSIANDIALINLEEYKEEILLEYKNNFDFAKAKLTVINKHQQIEELRKKQEEIQKVKEEEKKIEEKVDEVIEEQEITAPKEVDVEEEIIEVQFTVKGTLSQLKELKNYLLEKGIKYE